MAQTAPIFLSDVKQSYWQGVVYGPPGCGKTVFATTSQLPVFVFDVDKGMNAAITWRVKHGMPTNNCAVWGIETVEDFDQATNWLVANMAKFRNGLVVIDSATELQRIVARKATEKSKQLAPDQRQWGDIRILMENLTVKFRYMPVHLVYTCHEMSKVDADHDREVWRPSFDGRFASEYAKHFGWIARMVAKPVKGQPDQNGVSTTQVIRALNFGPDPFIHFKDRSGAMAQWEVPHLDSILQRMVQSTQGTAQVPQTA